MIKLLLNFIEKFQPKKPKIKTIIFWVGTKCSLKCKLCCNLIPFVEQKSYNTTEILNDIKFITDNAEVQNLQIQGGEPFTHPNIAEIIRFISKLDIRNIVLATNATIKLNSEVIQALKDSPNILVRTSDYECSENLRIDFINTLEDNKIAHKSHHFWYGNDTWFSTGGIHEERADNEKVKDIYKSCEDKVCHTLADGVLTICGKIPSIKEIYKNDEIKIHDEINIRKIRKSGSPFKNILLKHAIVQFLKHKDVYKEQCRYCNISPDRYPAGEQLTPNELKEGKEIISNRT